ncbi:hypothetical protein GCM10010411_76970 [Actinomadura fulvescens]|uniref:Uncharacterized protein n=1 Tax=Actinomadura fulvescens TaxID=46160 RepID=A0ABN3QJK7_9ACTN
MAWTLTPDAVGHMVLRPWNGDGPGTVLSAEITHQQVCQVITLNPRPHPQAPLFGG